MLERAATRLEAADARKKGKGGGAAGGAAADKGKGGAAADKGRGGAAADKGRGGGGGAQRQRYGARGAQRGEAWHEKNAGGQRYTNKVCNPCAST